MAGQNLPDVVMENVKIIYPNFEGKEDMYNRAGDRNFCIELPGDVANQMKRDGWNVKQKKIREEGDEPEYYLEIAVSYKVRPPKIWTITSRGRTPMGEDTVAMLDWAEIINTDLIINPYQWEMPSGASGIKAYAVSLYITIHEDPLELKYADTPTASR